MPALLIQVGPGKFGDGGIIVVRRDYDALRVHAEMLARGRMPGLTASARSVLWPKWMRITGGNRRPPSDLGLSEWWDLAEPTGRIDRADFLDFPFGLLERRVHLVVPLARTPGDDRTPGADMDIDEPTAREWERRLDESDEHNQTRKYAVHWRSRLVSAAVRETDVLDRLTRVVIPPQRASDIVIRRAS